MQIIYVKVKLKHNVSPLTMYKGSINKRAEVVEKELQGKL